MTTSGPFETRDANADAGSSNVDATPRSARAQPSTARTYKRKPAEDIFASASATPSSSSSRDVTPVAERPKRPRSPPRLTDGPFNHVLTGTIGKHLKGARPTGVTEDAASDVEEVWPPRRRRSNGKEKEAQQAPPRSVERRAQVASAPEVKVESQDPAAALHHLHSLPATVHHAFSQPTQDAEAPQVLYIQVQEDQQERHPFSQPSQFVDADARQTEPFRLPKAHLERLERELKKSGHPYTDERHASFATSTPVRRAPKKSPDVSVPGPSTAREIVSEGPSKSADLSRSVRFETSPLNDKGKGKDYGPSTPHVNGRRHTLGGSTAFEASPQNDRPHTDHIRVRQSLPLLPSAPNGARSADDSFVGTASSSITFRRPLKRTSLSFVQQPKVRSASVELEPPLQISEDDESVVVHIGVETAVQTMSENHGFNPEIVRRVWNQTQSLRKTDEVLRRMREAAEKAALRLLGDDGDVDEDIVQPRIGSGGRERSPARSTAPRRSSHKRNSNSILRITPTEADQESIEYSPRRPTRAARYARLVKEGRQDEAHAREVSYAYGASPMETPQRNASEVEYRANGSSPETAVGVRHHFDGDQHSTAVWGGGTPDQASSREVPLDSVRNIKVDAAKIALGKKLGQMLANVEV